jgi:putative spermidine/putrescine transport system substrate-binding protein
MLFGIPCAVTLAAGALTAPAMAGNTLTIVSWGGSYTDSQKKAFFEPYAAATGATINIEDYNGGLGAVRAQVESKTVTCDVIEVELQAAVRGCDEGLFEPIDPAVLPKAPDGIPAGKDFLPGTLQECGIGNIVWSNIFAYNERAFPGEKPSTVADFFDIARFPGKRGMIKKPQVNMEWALIADGVPADQVYETLKAKEGVDRAFRKLDAIKAHVIWWETGAQPPQLLADGEVTLSGAYNGRIYSAIVDEGQPFRIIWNHQIWNQDLWAIPAGSKNVDAALDFIAFASRPERMADQTNYIFYGPARKSAAALIDPKLKPHMPTSEENFRDAIAFDFEFWADHVDELNERFSIWLAK